VVASTSLRIRSATADDAESIGRMWAAFAAHLRELGDTDPQAFGVEAFRRDGFGADPAFVGIIAELGGAPAGYLLYHFGYDVDRAARLLHVADLWVEPAARRAGVGRALMREAAARCRARGGVDLVWAVFNGNKLAFAFYEGLGAKYSKTLSFMHLSADSL
jgi:ribosomal protein S18 acetylase RimI-like enzyme